MTSPPLALLLSAALAFPPAAPAALSRRTTLTRFNSVESQATYDAANRLLELKHLLLPIKFVWAQPRSWRAALASLFYGLSTMDYGLGEAAHAAPPTPTVSAVRPIQLPPDVLATVAYTYDAVGNRLTAISTQPSAASTQNYGYDPLSQLTAVTGAQTHSYTYDAVGNRQQADGSPYVPNNLNQYSTVGGTTYSYDPNGNLTNDGTNTYTFDAENRLVSASGPSLSATYTYDAFGRRISKTVNGTTTKFTWDGDQLIEELNGTGTQLAEYINGPGIDEPLRMQRGTTKTYYLADGLGSITHLTNASGAIVESYTYDPYGKPTILDATGTVIPQSAFGNRFLFTGREYDQETGLQNNRHRDYDSRIGRFLQRDPYTWGPNDPRIFKARNLYNRYAWFAAAIRLTAGGQSATTRFVRRFLKTRSIENAYLYVENNPLNWVDALGQDEEKPSIFDQYAGVGIYLNVDVTGVAHFTTTSGWDLWIQVGPINLSSFKTCNKEPTGTQFPITYNLNGTLPGGWYNIDWWVLISGSGGIGVTSDHDIGGGNQGNFPGGYYYP